MKFWFWVKFTIAAFMLYGLAAHYGLSQTPAPANESYQSFATQHDAKKLKACQAKYASTVDQLTTATMVMSLIYEPDRRRTTINLSAAAQHSYDLLAADPAHSAEALCAPQRLADLDAVTASLREAGYLPDHGERAAVQARLSDESLRDAIARFRVVFSPGTGSPNSAAREPEVQKRPTSPRTNPGVQPPT
jgi:hypothetical protein